MSMTTFTGKHERGSKFCQQYEIDKNVQEVGFTLAFTGKPKGGSSSSGPGSYGSTDPYFKQELIIDILSMCNIIN